MINRFFNKSDNIDEITDKEVHDFLRKEKVTGRLEPTRVVDFYNVLSRIANGESVELNKDTQYDYFGADTQEKIDKINTMRDMEQDFVQHVSKDVLNQSRLLKAAAAIAREFEKMSNGQKCTPKGDLNELLRNLFDYEEERDRENKPAAFGEIMDMDFLFLRYIALLSKKRAFLKKTGRLVRAQEGNIHKYTPMETFDEVFHMDMTSIVMPNFKQKLAQKDVYVRSRFIKQERGQNLIILVDDSSSMATDQKKAMLKAALTLKLNDISPAHNLYIGTFETSIFGFKKIEKGTTFADLNSFITLSWGGTDINGCLMDLIGQIKARKLMARDGGHLDLSEDSFEILIVNDGQDAVDKTYHPAIKTHALCLMQSNQDLKHICHRSGGTYFHIQAKKNE